MKNPSQDIGILPEISLPVNWQVDEALVRNVLVDYFDLIAPHDDWELIGFLRILSERLGIPYWLVQNYFDDYVACVGARR